jgi:hypothetical protein
MLNMSLHRSALIAPCLSGKLLGATAVNCTVDNVAEIRELYVSIFSTCYAFFTKRTYIEHFIYRYSYIFTQFIGNDAAALVHHSVLYLAARNVSKQTNKNAPKDTNKSAINCPWGGLLRILFARQPHLTMSSLRDLINVHRNLFSTSSSGLQLCQLNHNFVRGYFDLATIGLDVIDQPKTVPCFILPPCSVKIATTVDVVGLVGMIDAGRALFQFDNTRAYRLQYQLRQNKTYKQGQKLIATVCFRQHVKAM